jgi:hypothetical protein
VFTGKLIEPESMMLCEINQAKKNQISNARPKMMMMMVVVVMGHKCKL